MNPGIKRGIHIKIQMSMDSSEYVIFKYFWHIWQAQHCFQLHTWWLSPLVITPLKFQVLVAHPIPTEICLFACSRVPATPEKMIITESGMAPSRGRTTPPMMAAGRPRSRSNSAPSTGYEWKGGGGEEMETENERVRGTARERGTQTGNERRWQMD